MHRKVWIRGKVLLLVLCLVFVAACGKNAEVNTPTATDAKATPQQEEKQTSEPTPEPTPEPVTLTLWNSSTPSGDKGAQALIDAYQQKNPHVKIEFTGYPGDTYETAIKTALAGKTAPDLYFTHGYNNLKIYVDSGDAEPLVSVADEALYDKASLLPVTVGGKVYAGPGMSVNIVTIWYNKEIFEQNGLSVPKTSEEFANVLEKLKSAGVTPFAMGGAESFAYLLSLFTMAPALLGDSWYEEAKQGKAIFTDPRFAKLNETLIDWGKKGYYQKNYEGTKFESSKILFQTGKAAMLMDGTWDYNGIKEAAPDLKLGAFNLPGIDGIRGTRSVNAGFTVYSGSKHKEVAIDFIKFTYTLEAAKIYAASSGSIPVLAGVDVAEEGIREAMVADGWQEFLYTPFNIVGVNNSNPQEVWQAEFTKVSMGQQTIDEMMKKVDATYDKEAYKDR